MVNSKALLVAGFLISGIVLFMALDFGFKRILGVCAYIFMFIVIPYFAIVVRKSFYEREYSYSIENSKWEAYKELREKWISYGVYLVILFILTVMVGGSIAVGGSISKASNKKDCISKCAGIKEDFSYE